MRTQTPRDRSRRGTAGGNTESPHEKRHRRSDNDDADVIAMTTMSDMDCATWIPGVQYSIMAAEPLFGSAATEVVSRTKERENQRSDESSEVTKFIGYTKEVGTGDCEVYVEEVLDKTRMEMQRTLESMMGICACMEDLAEVAL
eukprot:CAMPEP_0204122252 /NCGR_PEP_ID=MMETSP0361-20130328/8634_1 /ASSEMBLY_ACC=CAM_ASM_000343 /TAXON_ID=268821 /ORGANISM="Scrippsiella Hangoei, Strain SHTV-5" /LENGTH=143 /DNA_ID=CAMNT_0051073593 /DNA_START=226 /DNA_END=654 /DNA_ORIENTATION=-